MDFPVEEIAYKMKFIMDKLNNGEDLTKEEALYAKKIMNFKSIYEDLCLEKQLLNANIEESRIVRYLVDKKKALVKIIKGTKSRNKLEQLYAQVANIDEFIKSGAVQYFKDFLIDHNDLAHVNVRTVFDNLVTNDSYLSSTRLDRDTIPHQGSPFIYENYYTGEVTLNRPMIDLVRLVLAGDFKIYNALEKRDRILSKNREVDNIEELNKDIPESMRRINIKDISKIIYLGRGRIGNPDDHTFDNLKDDLEILVAIDQVKNAEVSVNDQEINNCVVKVLDGIVAGTYKPQDFTNYHILRYFDKNTDTSKFREILIKYRFNLDVIKSKLLQDDLLSKTTLNGNDNLFVDRSGELVLDNLSLANSVMNGEKIDEDECLSADPKCLGRIKYYQPAHRVNPHEYEHDKYDVKILLAIARYKEDLRLQKLQVQTEEENKALL